MQEFMQKDRFFILMPLGHIQSSLCFKQCGSIFPKGVRPIKLRQVSGDFHSLYSATGKRYRYRACKGWAEPEIDRFVLSLKEKKPDLVRMKEGATFLLGSMIFPPFR